MKKRLLCLALALILVLTATPTLASEGRFEEGDDDLYRFPGDSQYVPAAIVTGGPSQRIVEEAKKDEPNSMDVHIEKLDLNGQSNFLFRGYVAGTDTPCTYAREITGTGYRAATYTSSPESCDMLMSIASTSSWDRVYFTGWWAI